MSFVPYKPLYSMAPFGFTFWDVHWGVTCLFKHVAPDPKAAQPDDLCGPVGCDAQISPPHQSKKLKRRLALLHVSKDSHALAAVC